MAGKPYSSIGKMLENARKKKKLQDADRTLRDKTPGAVSAMNEHGYIRENGLDREDAKKRATNRKAFNAGVNSMVRKNEYDAYTKQGIIFNRDIPMARAVQRGYEQKKKREGKK